MIQPQPDTHTTRRLWADYARTRDPKTRDRIVAQFERLAYSVAHRYARDPLRDEDLFQVALLGLVKAVDCFDPANNCQFSSFAVPTIAGEIRHYFRDCSWHVHVPRAVKELHQRAQRARKELAPLLGRSPSAAEIAARLGLPEEEVCGALALDELNHPVSLEAELGTFETSNTSAGRASLEKALVSEDADLRRREESLAMAQALASLSPALARVLRLRYMEELSLREVGRRLGVSAMTVCRLEKQALHQLSLQFASA